MSVQDSILPLFVLMRCLTYNVEILHLSVFFGLPFPPSSSLDAFFEMFQRLPSLEISRKSTPQQEYFALIDPTLKSAQLGSPDLLFPGLIRFFSLNLLF